MKKKINKSLNSDLLYYLIVKPTINNVFVTLTDINGNVVLKVSSGMVGFKGSTRSSAYAAEKCVENILNQAYSNDIKIVKVFIKGFLMKNIIRSVIKSLEDQNVVIISEIEYLMVRSHNGVKRKKSRRL